MDIFNLNIKRATLTPYAWLKDVLTRLPDQKVNNLDDFLANN